MLRISISRLMQICRNTFVAPSGILAEMRAPGGPLEKVDRATAELAVDWQLAALQACGVLSRHHFFGQVYYQFSSR